MTRICFLTLLLMAAVPSVAQAKQAAVRKIVMPSSPQVVREYATIIRIDVDTHGQVRDTGTPTRVPSQLAGAVRKLVSAWRFKPGQWQGRAVSIRTWVHAFVEVVKRSDQRYGLRVVYNGNGPRIFRPTPVGGTSLLLLRQAMRGHDHIDLRIAFQVDADGSLSRIREVSGNHDETRLMRRVRKVIEHWHANPMLVNGKPATSQMHFRVDIGIDANEPRRQNRRESAWVNSPPGIPVAVDSPLQAPIKAHSSS